MTGTNNDNEKLNIKDDFSEMFVKLIDTMVDFEHFSRDALVDALCRLARSFRLTKVVTEFYKSMIDEKDGEGETLCDFDEGPADIVVLKKELISKTGAIVRVTAYAAKGTEPLSREEEQQLDITMRAMMSYIGRNRLQTAVEKLAFHDNNGYPNFAYFFRHLGKMSKAGGFFGFTAAMYNLKDFSDINRNIGFEGGNEVMKAHYEILRDMIGERGTVCRVGGDNFAAIFPNELLDKIIAFLEGASIIYDQETNVVRISINFSRKHLTDPKLLDSIVGIVNRYDIPYEYIEIELTETTTEGDYHKLKKLVEGLKETGIHTSIDDFGIGYSSLNLIRDLPWNVMKIDRSLLPTALTDKNDLSTVLYKHITAMAYDMGLGCLTEGVETAEQVQILRDNSCEFAQGYFYDRPLPLDEFEKRLEVGEYPVN